MPARKKCVNWMCRIGLATALLYTGVLLERHVLHSGSSIEQNVSHQSGSKLIDHPIPIEPAASESAPAAKPGPVSELAPYVEKFAAFLERFPDGELRLSASGDISFDPTGALPPRPGSPPFISRGSDDFSLVDSDFVLTSQAINELSLDDDEALAVQAVLEKLQGDYREAFAARAKADPLRTDEAAGVYAFFIPAFVADSESMLADFSTEVSGHIGEPRSQRLLEIFNMPNHLASFGTRDVFVEFNDSVFGAGQRVMRANWEQRDPATGKMLQRTQASMEDFERDFGKVFSVDDRAPAAGS